ncbi:hypothetical protein SUGI_0255830 [Cryptomeria japonica]|nr:hypothetical protein SUGI_0255830 [Cryptomeria japonica]
MLNLGGLAKRSATAQSCLTSSAISRGRVRTAFSISMRKLMCGMLRGVKAKLRPRLRKLKARGSMGAGERLTTSLDSQLLMGLRIGADLGRVPRSKAGGGGAEKTLGQDCKEWDEFTTRGMVGQGLCGGR